MVSCSFTCQIDIFALIDSFNIAANRVNSV